MRSILASTLSIVEAVWNTLFNFCLAGAFLMVWSGSQAFGENAPRQFVLIIVIEFILLLCGIALAGLVIADKEQGRMRASLLVAAGFLVSIGALSLAEQAWWPFVAAILLLSSRLRMLFPASLEQHEEQRQQVAYSLGRLLLLFVLFFVFAFLPIPEWGVTPLGKDPAIFTHYPQRALVIGVCYFGLLGIFAIVESITGRRGAGDAEE